MKAIDFTLPYEEGKNITLSDYKDKNIVLYFYPKDDTPGCTIEAIDFSGLISEFDKLDTVVFGISKDSLKKHDNFICKHDLKVTLLSDIDSDVCEKYGVWQLKKNYGKEYMGIVRTTILIDKNFNIIKRWDKVSAANHANEVLEYVKNL